MCSKTGNSQGGYLKYKYIQMSLVKGLTISAYSIYKHRVYYDYLAIYMQCLWQFHIQPLLSYLDIYVNIASSTQTIYALYQRIKHILVAGLFWSHFSEQGYSEVVLVTRAML